MTTIDKHHQAMEFCDKAFLSKSETDKQKFLQQAFQLEKECANSFKDNIQYEPTRSVLYRSAATIAYQLKYYLEALELISEAKTEFTPYEIEEELKDILKQILKELNEKPSNLLLNAQNNKQNLDEIKNNMLKEVKAIYKM